MTGNENSVRHQTMLLDTGFTFIWQLYNVVRSGLLCRSILCWLCVGCRPFSWSRCVPEPTVGPLWSLLFVLPNVRNVTTSCCSVGTSLRCVSTARATSEDRKCVRTVRCCLALKTVITSKTAWQIVYQTVDDLVGSSRDCLIMTTMSIVTG